VVFKALFEHLFHYR